MTKNIIFPTLLLLAATPNVCAQTAMPMTLEQLFERVEQGSRTLAAAKTNVDAAQHGIDAALSQRLPDLSANLSVSYIGNALLTDRDFSNAHGLHSPHLGNSFAIEAQEAIYTGGALSAGIKLAELGKNKPKLALYLHVNKHAS